MAKSAGQGSSFMTTFYTQHHKNIVSKYGRANIKVIVFECASETQAFDDERRRIAQLRAEGCNLLNICDGGQGASGHSAALTDADIIVIRASRESCIKLGAACVTDRAVVS